MLLRWRAVVPGADVRCNAPVFSHGGTHLFTPDLIDVRAGVVGQYDGVVHDQTRVRRRDLQVEELCRDLGLEVVRMISTDLRAPEAFEARLRSAYRRSAGSGTGEPAWTLTQPPWWIDTSTVAARRGLSSQERRRWLPHRE